MNCSIIQSDRLAFLRSLPADSVDLVFGSPPYEAARTYGIDFKLRGQPWVDWMVETFVECKRVCKGLVAMVLEGQTRGFRWSAVPALLMADLHRLGFNLRKPPAFRRNGIAGSGGPDWLRNDYEFIVCTTKGRLPWSNNTAMGHRPKWAPGGEMSNRLANGQRVNQWGGRGFTTVRQRNGALTKQERKSHRYGTATRGVKSGDTQTQNLYMPPAIANPGNVIACKVGGGLMGDKRCHDNEAPFPEKLAEFFILSFCPPGGTVCDVFSGSGTTAAMSIKHGRNFVGCDIRQSQVDLGLRRVAEVQPVLF